ncbi:MAG: hypothetical protein SVY53_04540 [Chloroflexota bacterium]|nr:hypothetical protein [Chloroflexota bacterium]
MPCTKLGRMERSSLWTLSPKECNNKPHGGVGFSGGLSDVSAVD